MAIVDWGGGLTGRTRSLLVGAVVVLLTANAVALAAYDDDKSSGQPAAQAPTEREGTVADGMGEAPGPGSGAGGSSAPKAGSGAGETASPPKSKASERGAAAAAPTSTTLPTSPTFTTTTMPPYTYKVTLEPKCAKVGERFILTFDVEPLSAVVAIARHPGGQTYGTIWGSHADDSGKAVHTWVAPPAPGPGNVLTGATTPDGRSGGTSIDFRIVEATDTC